MSWSKCKIEVGKTGDDEAMAASLTDIGTINDKSTTLATEDGETLTATATGGIVVAEEEGSYVDLTFKILACSDGELYKKFRVKAEDWAAPKP